MIPGKTFQQDCDDDNQGETLKEEAQEKSQNSQGIDMDVSKEFIIYFPHNNPSVVIKSFNSL